MQRVSIRVVVAVVSCAFLPASARADQQCKPVVGSFEAQVVGGSGCSSPVGLCTAGRVWGGIQGTYAFTMTTLQPADPVNVPSIFFFTGQSVVTLKNDAIVRGTDTGAIDVGAGGFASLITFRSDAGAPIGQIRLRGDFDPVAGTTSGDYLGTLCQP
jgi:hypothetical protein